MNIIWKFPLDPVEAVPGEDYGQAKVQMPASAEVLSTQTDNKTGVPTIWALCDPDEPKVTRTFIVHPTGVRFTKRGDWKYIGTCQVGWLVWHIAELLRPPTLPKIGEVR